MRHTCENSVNGEECGKLAVEYVIGRYLCAEHYDHWLKEYRRLEAEGFNMLPLKDCFDIHRKR
jgi:hypothetical protein